MGMARVIMIQTVFFSQSIHQSPNQSYLLACAYAPHQRCLISVSPTEVGFETSWREIYWKSGDIIMLKASYFLAGKEHLCRRANYEEPFASYQFLENIQNISYLDTCFDPRQHHQRSTPQTS